MGMYIQAKLWLTCLLLVPAVLAQPGTLSGTVVDSSGAVVAGAKITLSLDGRAPDQETESTVNGDFSFATIPAGAYNLSFRANGFAPRYLAGELPAGQTLQLAPTALALDPVSTRVNVTLTQEELAQTQITEATRQRLVGVIPNFFTTYDQDAAPLNAKQKLELTARQWLDPATFFVNGIIAGVGQAQNTNKGFGQGAQGYAKRYGAGFIGYGTGLLLEKVVVTTLARQDPRYFYQGTGSKASRAWHAVKWTVVCRGDNKREQFCYSGLISRFGNGFVTRYFFPASARDSSGVILRNSAIGLGFSAVGNLFQEFVSKKITRKRK